MRGDATDLTPGIDIQILTGWLVDELALGAEAPLAVQRIGDGKSNLTYLVSDRAGRRWVLRRPPLGVLLPSAHDVVREFSVLSRLTATDVPIARPLGLRQVDESVDVALVLMEFLPGLVIDSDAALATVGVERRRAIGLSIARTLSLVHAVDLEAASLGELASHEPYAPRQLRRWTRQLQESKTRERPVLEDLARRLADAAPEQTETTLVHGDYNLSNVITDSGDGHVVGVLDWELCTLGEPLADLGGLLAYWPQADDDIPPAPTKFPAAPGFPGRDELVFAYADASGRDVSSVGYWEAFGCWKIAVIGEGVLSRRLAEPGNGDPAEARELVELMILRADAAARRAGI